MRKEVAIVATNICILQCKMLCWHHDLTNSGMNFHFLYGSPLSAKLQNIPPGAQQGGHPLGEGQLLPAEEGGGGALVAPVAHKSAAGACWSSWSWLGGLVGSWVELQIWLCWCLWSGCVGGVVLLSGRPLLGRKGKLESTGGLS